MQAKRATTLSMLCAVVAAASCRGNGTLAPAPVTTQVVRSVVGRLDVERYKATILGLTVFGDRMQGTQRNLDALNWIEAQLKSYGYANVERHRYTYRDSVRENIYATKVGTTTPGEMYIVSAHMDGRGGGEAADDDASGVALVLELARVLGSFDIETTRSVRFILWNNEESGLDGSRTYVQERAPLQGVEDPAGSMRFPEPKWLGIIQHDMLLFDHGMPAGAEQVATADIDIEYQTNSTKAQQSAALAATLLAANHTFATDYPAEVSTNMSNTDSRSFQDVVASISIRENQRVTEIGRNSNPHWHKATDVYAAFSEADFRLGFNAAQTTLGAIGQLAGLRLKAR